VDVFLNDKAAGCAATAAQDLPLDRFEGGFDTASVPVGSLPLNAQVTLPAAVGEYHLCVYASRDGHEGDPDLVKDAGVVRVVRPLASAQFSLPSLLRAGAQVTLSGSAQVGWPVTADVYLNEQAVDCKPSSAQNQPFDQFGQGLSGVSVPAGGAEISQTVLLPTRLGQYRLCAYLTHDGFEDSPDLVKDFGTVTVARAQVTVDLGLEGFLVPSAQVRLVGSASSDFPVTITALLNHKDDACATSAQADASVDQFQVSPDVFTVSSGPVALTSSAQLPDTAGSYHLCVYASREGADADPDFVSDSASSPTGMYFVQVKRAGIDEIVYADGTHGTFTVSCKLSDRRPVYKQKVALVCPHVTGKIRFSYRRIEPRRSAAHARTLRLSSDKNQAVKSTGGMYPGLYRIQIKWNGWVIHETTMRIHHPKKAAKKKSSAKRSARILKAR
jgi:hypothetical protein